MKVLLPDILRTSSIKQSCIPFGWIQKEWIVIAGILESEEQFIALKARVQCSSEAEIIPLLCNFKNSNLEKYRFLWDRSSDCTSEECNNISTILYYPTPKPYQIFSCQTSATPDSIAFHVSLQRQFYINFLIKLNLIFIVAKLRQPEVESTYIQLPHVQYFASTIASFMNTRPYLNKFNFTSCLSAKCNYLCNLKWPAKSVEERREVKSAITMLMIDTFAGLAIFFICLFASFYKNITLFHPAGLISNVYSVVINYLSWFMCYPAGLKLNSDLSKFFALLYRWIIDLWLFIIPKLHFPLLSITFCMGLSVGLAFLLDVLSMAFIPLLLCYQLSLKLYSWQLACLSSLFYLFRGKKWNVLRNRLDSAEYELDQLILGTVLFATLSFLFPTVAIYYTLFAYFRLLWLTLQSISYNILSLLIHFPSEAFRQSSNTIKDFYLDSKPNQISVIYKVKSPLECMDRLFSTGMDRLVNVWKTVPLDVLRGIPLKF